MSAFDFFDVIFCINLPDSTDRWAAVQCEFDRVGILDRVERVWTPRPTTKPRGYKWIGQYGAVLSHCKALQLAIDLGANNVLIFEDDVVFEHKTPEKHLEQSLKELPPNWDMFYLGGNPRERMTQFSDRLYRTGRMRGAYSYAVNSKAMPVLLEQAINANVPYDKSTEDFSKKSLSFAVHPYITIVAPGNSTITTGGWPEKSIQLLRDHWQEATE